MDPISIDANISGSSKAGASSKLKAPPAQKVQVQPTETGALMDMGKLSERVESSSAAIRPEAVERGKALLSDPNWPSESILEELAEKLVENEDFDA